MKLKIFFIGGGHLTLCFPLWLLQITVNGHHIYTYPHYLPLDWVTNMTIVEGVTMQTTKVFKVRRYLVHPTIKSNRSATFFSMVCVSNLYRETNNIPGLFLPQHTFLTVLCRRAIQI